MNFILINADPTTLESVMSKEASGEDMPNALYLRGEQCYNGLEVPWDFAKAHRFYRIAAGMGNAEAQYKLGLLYARGQGVQQSRVLAAKWTRRAAEQGLARAQDSLGAMYFNGYGVRQDFTEAQKWYQKAADQGFMSEGKVLNYLRKEYHLVMVGGVHRDELERINFSFGTPMDGNVFFILRSGDKYVLYIDWGREGVRYINATKTLDEAYISGLFYYLVGEIVNKADKAKNGPSDIGINQLKDNHICVVPDKERFKVGICIKQKICSIIFPRTYEDAIALAEKFQKRVDVFNEIFDKLVSEGIVEEKEREVQLKIVMTHTGLIEEFDILRSVKGFGT